MSDLRFWKGDNITQMTGNNIFVFGSNPEGRHGAGAAKEAQNFGAKYGIGRGLQGNTYALITKNLTAGYTEKATGITYEKEGYGSLSPEQIRDNIIELYEVARNNPEKKFFITYKMETWPSGGLKKSLNGYDSKEMWDLFTQNIDVPENIRFHNSFRPFLNSNNEIEIKPRKNKNSFNRR